MRNPHPNTSGLRPPWQKGHTGNPKGYHNRGRVERELLRLLKTKNLWPEIAKTFAVKAIGKDGNLQWMMQMLGILGQNMGPRIEPPDVEASPDAMMPDKAIYMAQRMIEIEDEYERNRIRSLSPEIQDVDPGDAGRGSEPGPAID